MIERAVERFGAVDIPVNNAGVQTVSPVEDFPPEGWNLIIAINMSAALHTMRAPPAGMKRRGSGRIINVASERALVASPFESAHAAAERAIAGSTNTVALEAAEHGATVNAIRPDSAPTPLVEKQIPETAKARGVTEDEVKRAVLLAAQWTTSIFTVGRLAGVPTFLRSDAAENVTGVAPPVDGGWMAA